MLAESEIIRTEFIRGLDSTEPTPDEVAKVLGIDDSDKALEIIKISQEPAAEETPTTPEGGAEPATEAVGEESATSKDPRIEDLKRIRGRRIREKNFRKSLGTDHREPERDHGERWWYLPLLTSRRSAIVQRTVREAFALIEEPFAPDSLAEQAKTAQPTNGEVGEMVWIEGRGQRLKPIFQAARRRAN